MIEFVALRIVDVHPFSGPAHGGTSVTVVGHGLQLGGLSCRFGDALVPATRQSAYRVKCITPTHPATGWVTMEVQSFSGIAESASAFFYQRALSGGRFDPSGVSSGRSDGVSSDGSVPGVLTPPLGPVQGGTVVTIVGEHFLSTASLSCRFGTAAYTVIARFLSSRTIECVAPARTAGHVAVDVSLNGQQFISVGALYLFHEVPTIVAVEPNRGPVEGGSVLTINGNHFSRHPVASVTCRMGTLTVAATLRSENNLLCVAPANKVGFIIIEVSNNLQDFSNSRNAFHYQLLSLGQVQPFFASQLGGEELTLFGTYFMPPHQHLQGISCLVGNSDPVVGRWESTTRVTCETQSTRQEGPATISLQASYMLFKETVTLIFLPRPLVEGIAPLRGPVRGGTKLTLYGSDLPTGPHSQGSVHVQSKPAVSVPCATRMLVPTHPR